MKRLRDVVIIGVATALTACVDSSAGPAPEVAERGNAALETAAAPAAACKTFAGTWQTDATAFATAIAPATQVDLSARGDGSQPTAGATVPRDEYLSFGILLDYAGDPGGRLLWTGNPVSGFTVKGKCPGIDECLHPAGVRITFVPAATAAGSVPGRNTAAMFDAQNMQISTMTPTGPVFPPFIGYQSAVPIDHAEFKDRLGAHITKVIYHRCL